MREKDAEQVQAIARDRLSLQKEIRKKWGVDFIRQARLRLCPTCQRQNSCFLYPICVDGTDCPYYKREKED